MVIVIEGEVDAPQPSQLRLVWRVLQPQRLGCRRLDCCRRPLQPFAPLVTAGHLRCLCSLLVQRIGGLTRPRRNRVHQLFHRTST